MLFIFLFFERCTFMHTCTLRSMMGISIDEHCGGGGGLLQNSGLCNCCITTQCQLALSGTFLNKCVMLGSCVHIYCMIKRTGIFTMWRWVASLNKIMPGILKQKFQPHALFMSLPWNNVPHYDASVCSYERHGNKEIEIACGEKIILYWAD